MTCGRKTRRVEAAVSWSVFAVLLATYWLTTPGTVSYWDCPEYVSAACLLEIGHPPGNPVWMLVERVVTMFVSPEHAAYAVNLSSGLFTALAGFFLASVLFRVTLWLLGGMPVRGVPRLWGAAGTAAVGALSFGWCDSTWYSAVEAEVYAMSIFFTALTVWLMVRWAFTRDHAAGNRLLVLIAYIFGLSIGVHQLNLLAIPALALIWGVRRGIRNPWKLLLVVALGMGVVGFVLVGVMPESIALAARLELLFVNTFGAPVLTGVVAFILLLGALLLTGLAWTAHAGRRRLNLCFWMFAMLLTGYGAYALVPIRGHIPSPANPTMPGEPFAFAQYQAREQYGGAPLLYGHTPYSKPLFREEWIPGDTLPSYFRYAVSKGHRLIVPAEEGRLDNALAMLSAEDSAANRKALGRNHGYVVRGYVLKNVYTPELDSWFPRITSRDPRDLASFADWAGMDTASMLRVAVSEALDTLGRPVARMGRDGVRHAAYSYKPTVAQNLSMLATYQISYMYLRYLMWNFVGRQNDIPSQGEVEHGNFITGITVLDNAMLGAEDSLPAEAGSANPGRNRYFAIPFLLGVAGLVWLLSAGKRGRAVAAVSALLFVMTGVAIVIYLNQSPGEPRERDYSFIGSFWTFAAWIGFGALMTARTCRTPWTFALTLLVPVWMCMENFNDHDRRGRQAASSIARSTLMSLDKDAVLFVDGDNFTFPLWYAQEVEGVRRDVRVVNMSYLGLPRYAANLMRPWRESKPLSTTLKRSDIIYDAFLHTRVGTGCADTLSATDALDRLRQAPLSGSLPEIPARYVRMYVPGLDSVVMDLRSLSESGTSRDVRFSRLMLFDILANAGARPIYWMNGIQPAARVNMDSAWLTPTLFGTRFGAMALPDEMKETVAAIGKVCAPNRLDRHVYMDPTPARMTGQVRAALIRSARRLMDEGRWTEAYHALYKADITMGNNPMSYPYVNIDGVLTDTRDELGRMQLELSPKLRMPQSLEFKVRGLHNRAASRRRIDAWKSYRRALPSRLRPLTAPLS